MGCLFVLYLWSCSGVPRPLGSFKRTPSLELFGRTLARVSDLGRAVPLTRASARDLVCEPIAAGPGLSQAGQKF